MLLTASVSWTAAAPGPGSEGAARARDAKLRTVRNFILMVIEFGDETDQGFDDSGISMSLDDE